jgi:putative tryptophan/tyrosine transport system substrate-binding protein
MRRRAFIAGTTAVLAWPFAARAQERVRRVGMLMGLGRDDEEGQARLAAFQRGLEQAGWIEGRTIEITAYWAAGDPELTRKHAAELVRSSPDVILVNTPPGMIALQAETKSIPIVFLQVVEPTESGAIAHPARPGGNVTGFTHLYEYSMTGKWLALLKEAAPRILQVMALQNPAHPSWPGYLRALESSAASLGMRAIAGPVQSEADIARMIAELAREPNGALLVLPDSFTAVHRKQIVSLAEEHRIPAVYPLLYFAPIGGLLTYGADLVQLAGLAAGYVDRILRGAKPGELPVQSSTQFKLIINMRTGRKLGLDIPPTLLARADEVIE